MAYENICPHVGSGHKELRTSGYLVISTRYQVNATSYNVLVFRYYTVATDVIRVYSHTHTVHL